MQLAVAATTQPVAVGSPRAGRDGRDAGVHGKAGLGAEPGHPGGLGDQLGRGQRPTAGQAEQLGGQLRDPDAKVAASWSMRMVSVWILAVSSWQMSIWADAGTSASQAAMGPKDGPGRRRAVCSRSGSSRCRCQRSRLIALVRSATRCSRWSTSSLTSQDAWSWPAVGRLGSRSAARATASASIGSDLPRPARRGGPRPSAAVGPAPPAPQRPAGHIPAAR
jgi:hypothetical protein